MLRALTVFALVSAAVNAAEPTLIFHHGKIVTVDKDFSIREAIAIDGERIAAVGSNDDILKLKGAATKVIDLGGKALLPGLMDSHSHATGACVTEFDHTIPDFQNIAEVLDYIRERAKIVKEGEWIGLSQVFITRLKEMRYPTRAELDEAAPKNPVIYRTGPDAALNSLALKLNNIDENTKPLDGGTGFVELDPQTGKPSGVIRNQAKFVKTSSSSKSKSATKAEHAERLVELLRDYNSVGITSIGDRDADQGGVGLWKNLKDSGKLTVRVALSMHVPNFGPLDGATSSIRSVADDPLFKQKDPLLRIIGTKTYLDGGMLTGSAYMLKPWGVSKLYGITDPNYRGTLYIQPERLLAMTRTANECGLQFTAHSVGDGAVTALLDAYEAVNKERPVRPSRPCITHSNFMTKDAVERCAKLGVVVDIQPIWLYLDARALVNQFGYDRLRYFQPLHSLFEAGAIAGGGSDHMQKIGSFRAVNPYNPFLAMQTAITRKAKWYDGTLHPEEALTPRQAIEFYTRNNAYLLSCDEWAGSLEASKRADFIILDQDLFTCPPDNIAKTNVLATYLDGKLIYERK